MAGESGLAELWEQRRTTIITIAVVLALIAGLVGIRLAVSGGDDDQPTAVTIDEPSEADAARDGRDRADLGALGASGGTTPGATGPPGDGQTAAPPVDGAPPPGTGGPAPTTPTTAPTAPGPGGPTGTALPGVTATEIRVVYYWRGDDTRTSPYLSGSGAEGNVDEGDAFLKFVEYLNTNSGTGAKLMGYEFDLHGRTIVPTVLETGRDEAGFAAVATRITEEIKPLAAMSPTGSSSNTICPVVAAAGIHNFATYDLRGNLAPSTNGYCTPAGLPWERQVELSAAWIGRQATQGYSGPEIATGPDRVYGVVYSEQPGLVDNIDGVVAKLEAAGANIEAVVPLSPSLSTAQQQAPNAVAQLRGAGVNTVIMPDGGAALNMTHAAQANGYQPDWYVWPCSGQDTDGFARLLNPAQWSRASGLSCYDAAYVSDVALNDTMRASEWYDAYKSVAPNAEPPAQSPFVWHALLPLVVGITEAGPDLTVEGFRAGLDGYRGGRYDFIAGPTSDATRVFVDYSTASRAAVLDAITVQWNSARSAPGAATPGVYDFPEGRRYRRAADF